MLATLTTKGVRTHRHIRSLASLLTSTGPGRARWPRLRETEQLQRVSRSQLRPHPRSYQER